MDHASKHSLQDGYNGNSHRHVGYQFASGAGAWQIAPVGADASAGICTVRNLRFEKLTFHRPGSIQLHANTDGLIIDDVKLNFPLPPTIPRPPLAAAPEKPAWCDEQATSTLPHTMKPILTLIIIILCVHRACT